MSLYARFDAQSNLARAVEDILALDRRDALWLADQIRDDLIEALQRIPGIPPRSFADWAVLLAPLHLRIAERIYSTIDGHVDLDEVFVTIESMGW